MRTFSIRQVSLAAALLALGGTVAASPPRDLYGIVNLAPLQAFGGYVNVRGQAAFEYVAIDDILRVSYFNGERVLDPISPPGLVSALGGLNDKGEVAYYARHPDPSSPLSAPFRPGRWSAARGPVTLPSYNPAADAFTSGINNLGVIVGSSSTSPDPAFYRGARWSATNGLASLPAPTGIGDVYLSDINEYNNSVGYGVGPGGAANALVWDSANRAYNLGTFGAAGAVAHHINNRADIAGMLNPATGTDFQAFLWSRDKPTLRVGPRSVVTALNQVGELVGRIQRFANDNSAFLFSRARGFVSLHPAGFYASEAIDVNDSGASAGAAQRTMFAETRAWRWLRSGAGVDLNTRLLNPPDGLVLNTALAIGGNGDILANSNVGVVLLRANGGGTDAPVVGPIVMPAPRLNQPFNLSLSYRDRNPGDAHRATIDWGDGAGPLPAAISGFKGRGAVSATHTYTAEGDYSIIVRVTDSTGKTTLQYKRFTLRELGTPLLSGQGLLADGANTTKAAAPLAFRLSAPLALKEGSATPFSFQLIGRTSFRGEQLERITQDGNKVRLEGSGQLDDKAGYRFIVDATAGGAAGGGDPGQVSVRIVKADAPGAAQRAGSAVAGDPAAAAHAPADVVAGSLRQGSIQLLR
ncbi:PKD domain-containing protein [Massilia yuzhufengensis]|uniref:PKD domain-containing protein n=1 Tax=Massilia yuzhufengensis TaxID=1164594 RepID=A0A1I1H0G4_9BURK|nr:PKD domain-containing protein [Massilia yuzhufengensis]SFC14680.1 hypothetical protein SAMN05216204_10462 [Massilia yuzhufengensis]